MARAHLHTRRLTQRARTTPVWLVALLCAGMLAPLGWWALRPLALPPPPPSLAESFEAGNAVDARGASGPTSRAAVPERVWTVSLVDELFPEPPAPAQPPPPPQLHAELVAIVGDGEDRAAFVLDRETKQLVRLTPGDSLPGGATCISITDRAVRFSVGAREITLELTP